MTTYTCTKALTVPELKAKLLREGKTLKQWSVEHGYNYNTVCKVIGGTRKGFYGIGHEIAVRLGIKEGEITVNNPQAA